MPKCPICERMKETETAFEFDNEEEYNEAMRHLDKFHDCEKCHNKIVAIRVDFLGFTYCGYCGEKVKYPRLSKELFEKILNKKAKI